MIMWETRSTDGWQLVKWDPQQIIDVENEQVAFTQLRIKGQYWDPCELVKTGDYTTAPHYDCVLPSVALLVKNLEQLIHLLRNREQFESGFTLLLSPQSYQSLELTIGIRDDFVSSADKPALTLRYDATRIHSEWIMALDHSCIDEWVTQMELWMHQLI